MFPYGESKFYTEQIVERNLRYPFWNVGERTCKIYSERVNVHLDYYRPQNLDTRHSQDKRAMLVFESPPEYIDAKVVEFSREYATVPGKWSEYVTYNWEVPGIATTQAMDWRDVNDFTLSQWHRGDEVTQQYYREVQNYTGWSLPYLSVYAHRFHLSSEDIVDFSLGQVVYISATDTGRTVSSWHGAARDLPDVQRMAIAKVIAIIGNDLYTFAVSIVGYWGWVIWAPDRIQNVRLGRSLSREPRGEAVTARIDHEYFYAVNPDADFTATPPFRIYDPTEKIIGGVTVTNGVSDTIKNNTIPDWATYSTWIGKRWLQAEPSKLNRWMGNIWEITTVWVRAM